MPNLNIHGSEPVLHTLFIWQTFIKAIETVQAKIELKKTKENFIAYMHQQQHFTFQHYCKNPTISSIPAPIPAPARILAATKNTISIVPSIIAIIKMTHQSWSACTNKKEKKEKPTYLIAF